MRAATSRPSMPDFFSAQAVSAIPPAPALENSFVAAWPASVISVDARKPDAGAPAFDRDGTEQDRVAHEGERFEHEGEGEPSDVAVGDLGPDVGEIGQGGGDDDEAGDHRRARDDEHEHLPRGDAADGQRAVGLVHYGHSTAWSRAGPILQSRDPHTLRCG